MVSQLARTHSTFSTNLTAGGFCDTNLNGPVQFQGSQPIQVAHFANGHDFDSFSGILYGDPCEVLLLPTGHYLTTNIVVTLPNDNFIGDFNTNYVSLIVAQANGAPVASTNFIAIGSSGYYGAQIPVSNLVNAVSSSQPVGVEVYGFGYYDAYGYFGGIVK